MKFTYRSLGGRLVVEFDADEIRVALDRVSEVQEAFEEPDCGLCRSERIRFDVREFDGNRYFKMVCLSCAAQLDLSQHKKGGSVYPKRLDDQKRPLPFRGWYIHEQDADPRLRRYRAAVRTASDLDRLRAAWEKIPGPFRTLLAEEKEFRKYQIAEAAARRDSAPPRNTAEN